MYTIINRTNEMIFIESKSDFRIFPVPKFTRAKKQKNRPGKIRKPVSVVINGELFIFIKKNWDRGKMLALDYLRFCEDLPHLYSWEQKTRHSILKKRARILNQRIINEANAIGGLNAFERY